MDNARFVVKDGELNFNPKIKITDFTIGDLITVVNSTIKNEDDIVEWELKGMQLEHYCVEDLKIAAGQFKIIVNVDFKNNGRDTISFSDYIEKRIEADKLKVFGELDGQRN